MATYADAREFCLENPFEFALEPESCVLPTESADTLANLRAAFRADNLPVTITEEILVNEMADNHWRILRFREFEAMALADLANLEVWSTQIAALSKLAAAAERSFHRALKVLREMQKERGFHPALNRIHIAQAKSASGFVSQNPETPADQPEPAAVHQPAAHPPAAHAPTRAAEARAQFVSQNTRPAQLNTGFVSQSATNPGFVSQNPPSQNHKTPETQAA